MNKKIVSSSLSRLKKYLDEGVTICVYANTQYQYRPRTFVEYADVVIKDGRIVKDRYQAIPKMHR